MTDEKKDEAISQSDQFKKTLLSASEKIRFLNNVKKEIPPDKGPEYKPVPVGLFLKTRTLGSQGKRKEALNKHSDKIKEDTNREYWDRTVNEPSQTERQTMLDDFVEWQKNPENYGLEDKQNEITKSQEKLIAKMKDEKTESKEEVSSKATSFKPMSFGFSTNLESTKLDNIFDDGVPPGGSHLKEKEDIEPDMD